VGDTINAGELGGRDGRRHSLVDRLDSLVIERADHHQRRSGYLEQPGPRGRRVGLFSGILGLQSATVHVEKQLARPPSDTSLRCAWPIEPQPRLESVDLVQIPSGLGGLDTRNQFGCRRGQGRRGRGTPDPATDEHHCSDPLWLSEDKIDGCLSARRAGDDARAVRVHRIKNRQRIVDRRPSVFGLVQSLAVAARVIADTAMLKTQPVDHVLPTAAIGNPSVDKKDIDALGVTNALAGELRLPGDRVHATHRIGTPDNAAERWTLTSGFRLVARGAAERRVPP
jgi:hypothetical protein